MSKNNAHYLHTDVHKRHKQWYEQKLMKRKVQMKRRHYIGIPLLLLVRLRLFVVASTVSGVYFRLFLELLLLFVLFSLRIDDFDSVNGGGAFVDESDVVWELTFQGHANGGAFDIVSLKRI